MTLGIHDNICIKPDKSAFLLKLYTNHEIMSMLESKNFPAEIYIQRSDGKVINEDFGDEDDGGLLDNLYGNQLNAPSAFSLSGGQIDAIDFEKSLSTSCLQVEPANRIHKDQCEHETPKPSFYKPLNWKKRNCLMCKIFYFLKQITKISRFFSCGIIPIIFHDELCELMVKQSVLYPQSKRETNFRLTQNKIKVFTRILIASGLYPVSSHRLYWKNDFVCRNTEVCNAVRRNKCDKTMQYNHFADNSVLNSADKYAKTCLLLVHLVKRFGCNVGLKTVFFKVLVLVLILTPKVLWS